MRQHRETAISLPNAQFMRLGTEAADAAASTFFRPILSGHTSTGSGAPADRRRRKLWAFPTYLHCSIVGTCLSTIELLKIMAKFKGLALRDDSDLAIHEAAVTAAGHHDDLGRFLHKALDRRHAATIKRFNKAQDAHDVCCLWDEALQSGDIPGAYWALLTHPATTDELMKGAFGDVHMLSHLVGAANRADIRRLCALEAENADLTLKVEKQQAQLREAIVTRDAMIRRLNDVLAKQIAQERRTCPGADLSERPDEISALHDLIAALQKRLATEAGRRERAEQQHALVRAALAEANAALDDANKRAQELHEELAAAEAQLASVADCTGSERGYDLPLNLQGSRLLYVGGRSGQSHRLRAIVEGAQAEWLHHDGGLEERKGLLAGLVNGADAVFFPVDCVSHDAAGVLKRLCRQAGKPYLPLRNASLTSFMVALRRLKRPSLQASSTT